MASEIVEGDHTITARITEGPGDGIRAVDASRILQYLVGRTELTDSGLIAADVNASGDVTAQDASQLLQVLAGNRELPFDGQAGVWKAILIVCQFL